MDLRSLYELQARNSVKLNKHFNITLSGKLHSEKAHGFFTNPMITCA